jgi:hypothetical protein
MYSILNDLELSAGAWDLHYTHLVLWGTSLPVSLHHSGLHAPCLLVHPLLLHCSSVTSQVTEASRGTSAAAPDASSATAAGGQASASSRRADAGDDNESEELSKGPAGAGSTRTGGEGGEEQGPCTSSQSIWVVCQLFKEG